MPTCHLCGKKFPNRIKIEGALRNIGNRKLCLDCSPWKGHNTRKASKIRLEREGLFQCACCHKDFPFEVLDSSQKRRQPYCSKCLEAKSLAVVDWRRRTKQRAVVLKGGCCLVCGYSKATSAMVFHHLDPSKKDFSISGTNIHSWTRIQEELQKCVLLCNRCHSEVHEGLVDLNFCADRGNRTPNKPVT